MKKIFLYSIVLLSIGVNAQTRDGDSIFKADIIHEIRFTFHQTGYWDSLVQNYPLDKMMSCDIQIDDRIMLECGVQFKGNSSYNSYPGVKKPFNIDFNTYIEGQDYDGLKKLNLNNGFKDPTMIREKIFLDFCEMVGMPAPRATYAKLYINNTYWGLYTVVEQINKSFLKDWFDDKKGNLFKGDPHGDLAWKGNTPSSYYGDYELKTNEDINDWTDLVYLLDKINNTPDNQIVDSLNKIFDTDIYFKYWALCNIFANLDSYTGSGHNYYIYHDSTSGQFKWIMWDCNETFGNFNQGMSLAKIKGLKIDYIPNPQQSRPLNYKILQNTTLKTQYHDKVCQITNDYFKNSILDPVIDSLANKIRTDYYADPNKMFTNQQFEDNLTYDINAGAIPGGGDIAGLKSYISQRRDSLKKQLATLGCYINVDEISGLKPSLQVYPNPCNDFINIMLTQISAGNNTDVKIYDLVGNLVHIEKVSTSNIITTNLSHLKSGVYFIKYSETYVKLIKL